MQTIVMIGNEAESTSYSLICSHGLLNLNRSDLSRHVHANRNKRLCILSRTKPYCLGCASSSIHFRRKTSRSEGTHKNRDPSIAIGMVATALSVQHILTSTSEWQTGYRWLWSQWCAAEDSIPFCIARLTLTYLMVHVVVVFLAILPILAFVGQKA